MRLPTISAIMMFSLALVFHSPVSPSAMAQAADQSSSVSSQGIEAALSGEPSLPVVQPTAAVEPVLEDSAAAEVPEPQTNFLMLMLGVIGLIAGRYAAKWFKRSEDRAASKQG